MHPSRKHIKTFCQAGNSSPRTTAMSSTSMSAKSLSSSSTSNSKQCPMGRQKRDHDSTQTRLPTPHSVPSRHPPWQAQDEDPEALPRVPIRHSTRCSRTHIPLTLGCRLPFPSTPAPTHPRTRHWHRPRTKNHWSPKTQPASTHRACANHFTVAIPFDIVFGVRSGRGVRCVVHQEIPHARHLAWPRFDRRVTGGGLDTFPRSVPQHPSPVLSFARIAIGHPIAPAHWIPNEGTGRIGVDQGFINAGITPFALLKRGA